MGEVVPKSEFDEDTTSASQPHQPIIPSLQATEIKSEPPSPPANTSVEAEDSLTDTMMKSEFDEDETHASQPHSPTIPSWQATEIKSEPLSPPANTSAEAEDSLTDTVMVVVPNIHDFSTSHEDDVYAESNTCSNTHSGVQDSLKLEPHVTMVAPTSEFSMEKGSKKLFECAICCKRFTGLHLLKGHVRTHAAKKTYECKICGKTCNSTSYLGHHERTHSGVKPLACAYCDDKFYWPADLRRHERIHTGEKPFECSHCDKRFTQKASLKQHVRLHTGERPYSCAYCDKKFNRISHQQQHERTHTGVLPYRCEQCGNKFISSSNLKAHMVSHIGDTPFECEVCDKKFKRMRSLKKHKAIKHLGGTTLYECDRCDKSYQHAWSLSKHKKSHVGDSTVTEGNAAESQSLDPT